jgi:hypothetical protein
MKRAPGQAPLHEGISQTCSLSAVGALWACRPRHPWPGRQGTSRPARPEPCALVRKPPHPLSTTPHHHGATQLAGSPENLHCSSAASARVISVAADKRVTRGCFRTLCPAPAPLGKAVLPPCASAIDCSFNPTPQPAAAEPSRRHYAPAPQDKGVVYHCISTASANLAAAPYRLSTPPAAVDAWAGDKRP